MDFQAGETALYGKQTVIVLGEVGSGYNVVRQQDEEHKHFWIPRNSLCSPITKQVVRKVVKLLAKQLAKPAAQEVATLDPFIEWLRDNSHITAKMPEQYLPKFAAKYEEATGHSLESAGMEGVFVTPGGHSRWYSIHVHFRPCPEGIQEPSAARESKNRRSGYTRVLYSNEFGFELLAQGFLLGKRDNNVPKAA